MIPESTTPGRRVSWPALLAMVLVPLLVVGGLIGMAGTSRANDNVRAAIVNLDEAVEINGQYTPLGRQLAAAMIERDGTNISWTLADAKNAKDGLATGLYSAVVTIPREFSAAATSFSANDADEARKATIDVKVSENAPITDAALAQEIARLAQDTVNTMLTEGYLDGIYIGFNSVGDQFTTIVDAASQLADGATALSDGTGEVSNGLTQLSDGMGLLADNAGELNDGGAQLAEGAGQLATNAGTLTSGGAQLADGISQLASGSGQLRSAGSGLVSGGRDLAAGATQLGDGVGELTGQLPQLVDGVGQLTDGAEQLLGGIPGYTDGVTQVIGGVGELRGGLDQVIAGLDSAGGDADLGQLEELGGAATAIGEGVQGLAAGLGQVDQTLQGFASDPGNAPVDFDAIGSGVAFPAVLCDGLDDATCQVVQAAFAAGASGGAQAGFAAGTGTASAILNTPDASGASLIGGADALAEQSGPFFDGVTALAEQLPQLVGALPELQTGLQQISDGAGALVTGAQPLVDNADALATGSTELLGGMQQLDQQLQALPGGVEQLASGVDGFVDGVAQYTDGVGQYVAGVNQVVDGVVQLDDGVGAYVDGVGQYADGVVQVADGFETYVGGVAQYTAGVVSAADGVQELATGFVELDSGAEQLSEGLSTFASEMAGGADQVPSYSTQEREALSSVVASPVSTSDELVSTNHVGLAALLVVAGLWLAGLASYVVARAVPSDVVSSKAPSIALWARSVGLPMALVAGLGAVFGIIASVVLELPVGRAVGLTALLAATGVLFVLVNHALAAWLGNVGRGISVVLLVASVALGVTSAVPGWLSGAAAFSPLQSGLELVRTWMASGSGLVGLTGAVLLAGVIALGLSYLAIASRRQLSAAQFRRQLSRA